MVERGSYTFAEITSQPTVWQNAIDIFRQQQSALEQFWSEHSFDQILFTGCGSTYYLSRFAASLFQEVAGASTSAFPASEIALLPDMTIPPNGKTLLVTISRSGETTETIEAARLFRKRTNQPMLTITCDGASTLAKEADFSIAVESAKENSVAQTRSFASMTLITQAFAGLVGKVEGLDQLEKLPAIVERLLTEFDGLAKQLGATDQIQRYFFLGTGLLYGIACEAMLKMKEMSLTYSEAYHMLEFRHGPMSMVNDQTLVVGLVSESLIPHEVAVLRQMGDQGAQVITLAENDADQDFAKWSNFVDLASDLPEWLRPVTYLPVLQLMGYYRAMSKGLNPDQPGNLKAFIELENLTS